MTVQERERRTYDIGKEVDRLLACRGARRELRRQRDALSKVGADAAVNAVRAALRTTGAAIRHAEHRLRFAQAQARGEGRISPVAEDFVGRLLAKRKRAGAEAR